LTNIAALISLEPTVNLTSNSVVYVHHNHVCISLSLVRVAVGVKFNIAILSDAQRVYIVPAIILSIGYHTKRLLLLYQTILSLSQAIELINQGTLEVKYTVLLTNQG
jgi:hypothetical protein